MIVLALCLQSETRTNYIPVLDANINKKTKINKFFDHNFV